MAEFRPLRICVFGSSSPRTRQLYLDESFALGARIAELGHTCVNGAGYNGCMGALNKGCKSKNGQIIGISHIRFLGGDEGLTEKHVCEGDDLAERRMKLIEGADMVLALPGS